MDACPVSHLCLPGPKLLAVVEVGGKGTETIGRLEMSIQESGSGMRGDLCHGLSGPDLHRRPGSS